MPPQAQQFIDALNATIPLEGYLVVGAIMFAIGAWGALVRRNAVVVFMCIELMITTGSSVPHQLCSPTTCRAPVARGSATRCW